MSSSEVGATKNTFPFFGESIPTEGELKGLIAGNFFYLQPIMHKYNKLVKFFRHVKSTIYNYLFTKSEKLQNKSFPQIKNSNIIVLILVI